MATWTGWGRWQLRRDCDRMVEDGITPTPSAVFYDNMDTLRMIVSRGWVALDVPHKPQTVLITLSLSWSLSLFILRFAWVIKAKVMDILIWYCLEFKVVVCETFANYRYRYIGKCCRLLISWYYTTFDLRWAIFNIIHYVSMLHIHWNLIYIDLYYCIEWFNIH